jgi:hypothetical protein
MASRIEISETFMKRNRTAFLLATIALFGGIGIAHRPIQAQQSTNPTMEDSIAFIQAHLVPLDVSAHQRNIQDSEGYFGGGWAERQGFSIDTVAYDDQSKVIVFVGKYWEEMAPTGSDGNPNSVPRPEKQEFNLRISLSKLKLEGVKLEHNPYYEDFKRQAEIRDKAYPFSYSSSPEWWITFDGYGAGGLDFGLPVESQEMGQRVLKALLHAVELAGDRKAEPF